MASLFAALSKITGRAAYTLEELVNIAAGGRTTHLQVLASS